MDLSVGMAGYSGEYLTPDGNWLRVLGMPSPEPRACLFLDRDGVVIEDRHYLADPDGVELVPGAARLIDAARRRNMAVVVVTNQSGIARGYFGWAEYAQVEARMLELLARDGVTVDAVLACGYHRDGNTPPYNADHSWRKPAPGMLLAAGERLNLDMAASVLIGDKASDIKAARAAGLRRAVYIGTESEKAGATAFGAEGIAVISSGALTELSLDQIITSSPVQEPASAAGPLPQHDMVLALERLSHKLDDSDRSRVEYLQKLFARQAPTTAGYPSLRPPDCRRIIDALRALLNSQREFFMRRDVQSVASFWQIATNLQTSAIRQYPTEQLSLELLMAEAHAMAGDHGKARQIIERYAEYSFAIETDADNLRNLLWLDCFTSAALGRLDIFDRAFIDRFQFVARASRPQRCWRLVANFSEFLAMVDDTPLNKGLLAGVLAGSARASRAFRRRGNKRPFRRLMRLGDRFSRLAGTITLLAMRRLGPLPLVRPRLTGSHKVPATGPKSEIVVTRAMGGIGDLLMMTPGLRARAKRQGKPVNFAIKKQFFPLFENNPNVALIDIDDPGFTPAPYRKWYNLTACPAARYESRHVPNVRKGRVELFAGGMGVGKEELRRHGMHLDLILSDEQAAFRASFLAEHGLAGQPIIGVQPFSRDSYKDHPQMLEHIERLAADHKVLVFHHLPVDLPHSDNIVTTAGMPLAQSLSLVPACDVFLCVDSAFLHVAAALDIPCVALFGPTDGHTFTLHHARVTVLDSKDRFGCQPCWRNEDTPCQLTGMRGYSPCIAAIEYERIRDAVEIYLTEAPAVVQ